MFLCIVLRMQKKAHGVACEIPKSICPANACNMVVEVVELVFIAFVRSLR